MQIGLAPNFFEKITLGSRYSLLLFQLSLFFNRSIGLNGSFH